MELSFVYKISSPQNDKVYIGSTSKKLNVRLNQHKIAYNRFLNGKGKNQGSFDVVKFNDCIIEELESFEGKNRKLLNCLERKWFDLHIDEACNIEPFKNFKYHSIL